MDSAAVFLSGKGQVSLTVWASPHSGVSRAGNKLVPLVPTHANQFSDVAKYF